jgi:hypothetical protein
VQLRQIDHHIDALSGLVACLDATSLSGSEAADMVAAFSRLEKVAGAGKGLCAARVAALRWHEREGARDAASWLAEISGDSRSSAGDLLDTASRLDKLPKLEDAYRRGELSGKQAHEIARAGALDPTAEDELIKTARSTSLGGLRDAADRIASAARSREEDEARHRRVHQERHLRTWSKDGAFKGQFSLTPEAGARLMGPLHLLADSIFEEAWRQGRTEGRDAYLADALVCLASGDGWLPSPAEASGSLPPHESPRSIPPHASSGSLPPHERPGHSTIPPEPVVQASLVPLIAAAPDSPPAQSPDSSGGSPLVSPAGTPAGTPLGSSAGRAPGEPRRPRADYSIIMRIDLEALARGYLLPGEESSIDGVGHVPVSVVQSYLDRAKVRLVVTNGVAIDSIFSFKRNISVALDAALHHRDRTCVVPGCNATFHLERDHVREFAKGGPTSLENLILLCPHHHRLKTNKGFRIEGKPGRWRWLKPDGSSAPAYDEALAAAET